MEREKECEKIKIVESLFCIILSIIDGQDSRNSSFVNTRACLTPNHLEVG